LALVLVVAAVLAAVYLIVIPSLEDRLVNSRKDQVEKVAEASSLVERQPAAPDDLAASFASASNARDDLRSEPLAR
jgi:hypothetical protein